MKVELLSPAGNMESLKMAVFNGADAVYLGGKKYGARAFSMNFNNEELKEAINFCHIYKVKVYVTINTLIYDKEVKEFLNFVRYIYKIGADAIILQDYGMIDLIHKTFPKLKIHASTQMNIHTVDELKKMKELGFSRVVLSREVDIDTLKKMKEEVDIELEIFVQGSLCISSSGQCLMSYMIGKRSANRGECAACCRQKYFLYKNEKKISLKDEYLLSTKDLCLIDKVKELVKIGVDSFKIEGRMKSKEYVGIVTKAYRNSIDNVDYHKEKEKIFKIFNRGLTLGHLYNQKGKDFINGFRPNNMGNIVGKVINREKEKVYIKLFDELNQFDGIRFIEKEDYGLILNKIYKNDLLISRGNKNEIIMVKLNQKIDKNSLVYKTLDSRLIREISNCDKKYINLYGKFKIVNRDIIFEVNDGKICKSFVEKDIVEKSKNKSTTENDIKEKLNKLGNTFFRFSNIDFEICSNIFIPISKINDLRRKVISYFEEERTKLNSIYEENYNYTSKKYTDQFNYAFEVQNEKQLAFILKNTNFECYVSNYRLYKKYKNDRIIFKDSRIVPFNINNSLVGEISSVKKNCIVDTYLNVTNSYAVNFFHNRGIKRITLSYEMELKEIKTLIKNYKNSYKVDPNLEVVIYGKPEVMLSKYCVINTYLNSGKNCDACKNNQYYLKDKYNNKYKIKKNNCYMEILNYKNIDRLNEIKELKKIGIKRLRIILDEENEIEIQNIIKNCI